MSEHKIRSDAAWAAARDAYLHGGLTAREVCERFDLGLSAFRKRAKAEGFRLEDADDPEPEDPAEPPPPGRPFPERIAEALDRADAAQRRGRLTEARGWLALARDYQRLMAAAEADERRTHAAESRASIQTCNALAAMAKAGTAEAKALMASPAPVAPTPAAAPGQPAAATPAGDSFHSFHTLGAEIAALEARIAQRAASKVPANDLRVKLRKLRAQKIAAGPPPTPSP